MKQAAPLIQIQVVDDDSGTMDVAGEVIAQCQDWIAVVFADSQLKRAVTIGLFLVTFNQYQRVRFTMGNEVEF